MAYTKKTNTTTAEVGEAEVSSAPAAEDTNGAKLESLMEMMMSLKSTVDSLQNELASEKAKNADLTDKMVQLAQAANAQEEALPVLTADSGSDVIAEATNRLISVLGSRKSDKEVVIVHNREMLGGLSTHIDLNGLTIDFHTLGEQRVLSWPQFEECVSRYHSWFEQEILLVSAEYAEVAEQHNVPCVKRSGHKTITKNELENIWTKSEAELADYYKDLSDNDKRFLWSYWLGQCYQNNPKFMVRSKMETLNRLDDSHPFDTMLTEMNFNSTKR